MLIFIPIFIIHFLADFVFQSSKMATEKSHSLKWLGIHVGVYALLSLAGFVIVSFNMNSFYLGFCWWIANAALHFITDFFTSKVTARFWEQKNMRRFFVMIGFDQLIHTLCLVLTYFIVFINPITGWL